MLVIDTVTLAVFVQTSLRYRRLWTVTAGAFLAIIVGSHLATLIDFRIQMNTFKFAMAMLSYGILISVAAGTWAGRSRLGAVAELDERLQDQHGHDGLSRPSADQKGSHRGQIQPVGQESENAGAEAGSNERQAGAQAKKAEKADVAYPAA